MLGSKVNTIHLWFSVSARTFIFCREVFRVFAIMQRDVCKNVASLEISVEISAGAYFMTQKPVVRASTLKLDK